MATKKSQRIGIWIIAIALTVGTLSGFIAMIIAPQNEAADAARVQAVYEEYQKEATAYQEKTEAQQKILDDSSEKLSQEYYAQFKKFETEQVKKYDRDEAEKKLVTTELRKGTGAVIGDESTYAAYYVGWLANGKVFDGSIDGKKLKTPFIVRPGSVIKGWTEGLRGARVGSVQQITIPSKKGYGTNPSGDIPANSPLRFIVMPIKEFETLKQPEVPAELSELYG